MQNTENYAAWTIDIDSFWNISDPLEQLRFLVRFAVLAPSSHNSQPWLFRITPNEISVSLDPKKALPVGDPTNRQGFISLGCATQNICIAADFYGYDYKVNFLNDELRGPTIGLKFATPAPPKESAKDHLVYSINQRRTDRSPYLMEGGFIARLFQEEQSYIRSQEAALTIIDSQPLLDQVSEIAIDAGEVAMDNSEFRTELAHHIKSNTTRSFVGMPAFGMGIPTPPSYLVPFLIQKFNMNRASSKKNHKLLKEQTPAIVIISTPDDTPRSNFIAGITYEEIALRATRLGLSTAAWAAPIQDEHFRSQLRSALKTDLIPQVFFRVGKPTKKTLHSPRLPYKKVLE